MELIRAVPAYTVPDPSIVTVITPNEALLGSVATEAVTLALIPVIADAIERKLPTNNTF